MLNIVDVLCDEYKLFINFSNDPFRILRLVISIYKCTTFLSAFKQGPINVSRVTIPGSYDFFEFDGDPDSSQPKYPSIGYKQKGIVLENKKTCDMGHLSAPPLIS